ncbi:hypothetical protein HNR39_002463 [Glaciimonas immobilis]|uniref:Uncharacterized protein n=1 Tax=Glaciimonas immobilis TaxID=728004 RepID=A0A840RVM7_9BURK|nr:hypothetical protein [Glaciimonas immobilis]
MNIVFFKIKFNIYINSLTVFSTHFDQSERKTDSMEKRVNGVSVAQNPQYFFEFRKYFNAPRFTDVMGH